MFGDRVPYREPAVAWEYITATWFIPFSVALIILTLPLAARDPLLAAPFFVAAAGLSVYILRVERPGGVKRVALFAQTGLLVILAALTVARA